MKNWFLFCGLIPVLFALEANAQSSNFIISSSKADTATKTIISGTVISASSGKPLPYVDISMPGTRTGTTSDAAGKYEIAIRGNYNNIRFSLIGYTPHLVSFETGSYRVINVKMKMAGNQLNEVKIISA